MPHRVSSAPARRPGRPRQDGHHGTGRAQAAVSASSPSSARMWQACRRILRASERAARLPPLRSLTGGVVVVVGGRGAGVGLAGLIHRPAQHLRALPGQPPGRALAVRRPDGDVQPGEPDRLAGGGEPAGAAQPAGHRQRGDRADPVQPLCEHPRPGQAPGGGQQPVPQHVQAGLQRGEHVQRGVHLQLPGRRQVRRRRPRAAPRRSSLGAQRGLAQRRGALVEEHRMDALHPGSVLGPQIVVGLQQRPALQDERRRDPALRQPALGQQLPQVPGVGSVGLGVPLAAAGEGGISRLGDMRRDAGPGQLLRDVPPAGAPLQRERNVVPAGEPRQPGTAGAPGRPGRSGRASPPRSRSPGSRT